MLAAFAICSINKLGCKQPHTQLELTAGGTPGATKTKR